jgi:LPXTG-motif cell wall-anchored protein
MKKALVALCAVFLSFVALKADDWNKKTILTFKEAVELPGFILQPGTYVFKLVGNQGDRHVVQVMNAAENHNYGFILAVPNYKLQPSDQTVLRFEERPSNRPPALRAWFYPGDTWGQEFVYPKAKATEIAASAQVTVLQAEVKPAEKPAELVQEPVAAVTPQAEVVEVATVTPPPAPEPTPAPAELPQTGSASGSVMLIALATGLLGALLRRSKPIA